MNEFMTVFMTDTCRVRPQPAHTAPLSRPLATMAAPGESGADERASAESDGKPDSDGKGHPMRTVKLDLAKGFAGITLRNSAYGQGVEVEAADEADLVYKAGIRQNDMIFALNDEPVDDHERAIGIVNSAAGGEDAAKPLSIEYRTAAEAAAWSESAFRPATKSLLKAYLLWLVAPPLGLHLFYLERDTHCLLHVISFGGLLLGWVGDFFRMGAYVREANEDREFVRLQRASRAASPTPSLGLARSVAMLYFAMVFQWAAVGFLPAVSQANFDWWLPATTLLQPFGSFLGVWLVGRIPPFECESAQRVLGYAAAASVFSRIGAEQWVVHPAGCAGSPPTPLHLPAPTPPAPTPPAHREGAPFTLPLVSLCRWWTAIAAVLGYRSRRRWASYETPHSRQTAGQLVPCPPKGRGRAKRAGMLVLCVAGCWGVSLTALFRHATFRVMTEHGPQQIYLYDAARHMLRSPLVRQGGRILIELVREWPSSGWRGAWQKVLLNLDLQGEGAACEALVVAKDASLAAVKKAHRALVLELHPDKQVGRSEAEKAEAEAKFRRVQEAYELLTTLIAKRKEANEGKAAGQ